MRLLLLLPLLFLAGCGSPERSPELVLPAFWNEVDRWLESGENGEDVCQFLDSGVLRPYQELPDPCQAALEASFPSQRIQKVEPLGKSSPSGVASIWIQPVLLQYRGGSLRRDSAAALLPDKNWAIQSLDGLRFQGLEQEELYSAESRAELALLRSR